MVVLTAADVQALNSTPIDLVGELGDSKAIAVLGVHYSKASGAYSGGAACHIQYKDPANTRVANITAATMRANSQQGGWDMADRTGNPTANSNQTLLPQGIEITTATAYTGAGGDLTMHVLYLEAAA